MIIFPACQNLVSLSQTEEHWNGMQPVAWLCSCGLSHSLWYITKGSSDIHVQYDSHCG